MPDIPVEQNSYSNLNEVQHVGVTAKLQSPLKSFMLSYCSSTDSENSLYRGSHGNSKLDKFINEACNGTDTTITENSKSNLVEVQHVGVTAKLQSPLKSLMQSYSSFTGSENNLYRGSHSNGKYDQFPNEASNGTDTTITENSKILYEMKSVSKELRKKSNNKLTAPSKIKFQLYTKANKILKNNGFGNSRKNENLKMKDLESGQHPTINKIFEKYPEPELLNQKNSSNREIQIGIYPFEHGCAEYLKAHDSPPQIYSLVLAEKATQYATRFWVKFFGSLQIGVAFIVTFLLQSYRFALYTIINALLVEFLHMTSDYLLKPLLTVLFNGFLQPLSIFCFNILSTLRDVLQPIADTLDNFMKPIATVGRSTLLIHATYIEKNLTKNV